MKPTNTYTQDNWQFAKCYFVLSENAFGQYWPTMLIRNDRHDQYPYPIYIRDRNPFKNIKRAIKFVDDYIQAKGIK